MLVTPTFEMLKQAVDNSDREGVIANLTATTAKQTCRRYRATAFTWAGYRLYKNRGYTEGYKKALEVFLVFWTYPHTDPNHKANDSTSALNYLQREVDCGRLTEEQLSRWIDALATRYPDSNAKLAKQMLSISLSRGDVSTAVNDIYHLMSSRSKPEVAQKMRDNYDIVFPLSIREPIETEVESKAPEQTTQDKLNARAFQHALQDSKFAELSDLVENCEFGIRPEPLFFTGSERTTCLMQQLFTLVDREYSEPLQKILSTLYTRVCEATALYAEPVNTLLSLGNPVNRLAFILICHAYAKTTGTLISPAMLGFPDAFRSLVEKAESSPATYQAMIAIIQACNNRDFLYNTLAELKPSLVIPAVIDLKDEEYIRQLSPKTSYDIVRVCDALARMDEALEAKELRPDVIRERFPAHVMRFIRDMQTGSVVTTKPIDGFTKSDWHFVDYQHHNLLDLAVIHRCPNAITQCMKHNVRVRNVLLQSVVTTQDPKLLAAMVAGHKQPNVLPAYFSDRASFIAFSDFLNGLSVEARAPWLNVIAQSHLADSIKAQIFYKLILSTHHSEECFAQICETFQLAPNVRDCSEMTFRPGIKKMYAYRALQKSLADNCEAGDEAMLYQFYRKQGIIYFCTEALALSEQYPVHHSLMTGTAGSPDCKDLDARDQFGRTPIMIAFIKGNRPFVQAHLDSQFNTALKDYAGENLAHYMARTISTIRYDVVETHACTRALLKLSLRIYQHHAALLDEQNFSGVSPRKILNDTVRRTHNLFTKLFVLVSKDNALSLQELEWIPEIIHRFPEESRRLMLSLIAAQLQAEPVIKAQLAVLIIGHAKSTPAFAAHVLQDFQVETLTQTMLAEPSVMQALDAKLTIQEWVEIFAPILSPEAAGALLARREIADAGHARVWVHSKTHTPQHYALITGQEFKAELNDDLESKDFAGRTPLHCAVIGESLINVVRLLELGANPCALDHTARGALSFLLSARCSSADKYAILCALVGAAPETLMLQHQGGQTGLELITSHYFRPNTTYASLFEFIAAPDYSRYSLVRIRETYATLSVENKRAIYKALVKIGYPEKLQDLGLIQYAVECVEEEAQSARSNVLQQFSGHTSQLEQVLQYRASQEAYGRSILMLLINNIGTKITVGAICSLLERLTDAEKRVADNNGSNFLHYLVDVLCDAEISDFRAIKNKLGQQLFQQLFFACNQSNESPFSKLAIRARNPQVYQFLVEVIEPCSSEWHLSQVSGTGEHKQVPEHRGAYTTRELLGTITRGQVESDWKRLFQSLTDVDVTQLTESEGVDQVKQKMLQHHQDFLKKCQEKRQALEAELKASETELTRKKANIFQCLVEILSPICANGVYTHPSHVIAQWREICKSTLQVDDPLTVLAEVRTYQNGFSLTKIARAIGFATRSTTTAYLQDYVLGFTQLLSPSPGEPQMPLVYQPVIGEGESDSQPGTQPTYSARYPALHGRMYRQYHPGEAGEEEEGSTRAQEYIPTDTAAPSAPSRF